MSAKEQISGIATASYQLTTDGRIVDTPTWQKSLYSELSAQNSEAGYLLTTQTGAGKTEAVVIPALGLQRGGAPRRLFLIGHDGTTLDDHLHRLVPYLRTSAIADNVPRTLYLDTEETEATGQTCIRFCPDGSEDRTIALNPLEADVDLVLTTLSRFDDLFFGAGGVHGHHSPFIPDDGSVMRRDLFFFDEAHDYDHESFASFQRLVKFLFAQDKDIVVASSTMPAHLHDDLSFLELIEVGREHDAHVKTLSWQPSLRPLMSIKQEIKRAYHGTERVIAVMERTSDAEQLYERVSQLHPEPVFLYHQRQSADKRHCVYTQLTNLEKEGKGYLLVTTGKAMETTDLDAEILISTFCPPENLILRAGRCNRHGKLAAGRLIIVGSDFDRFARRLGEDETARYCGALSEHNGSNFDPDFWKKFI